MKCEICNMFEARTKDFRTFDGITSKIHSCNWCAGLNDASCRQIQEEKSNPLDYYEVILFEQLTFDELEELNDIWYAEIESEISDNKLLGKFLELNRELQLRETV